MGNCQAVDAAALVIQHPNGHLQRMYCPIVAGEVMKMNPGHYVSLIIPLPEISGEDSLGHDNKMVRYTRVKLLRQDDMLVLGRAYKLVTSQEVMKVVREKKHAKMKKEQSDKLSDEHIITTSDSDHFSSAPDNNDQGPSIRSDHEYRQRSAGKHKQWQPSLNSISESTS